MSKKHTQRTDPIKLDIPANMPLTNRLDKMTLEQGRWAIANGDAWLAYLRENGGEIYTTPTVEAPAPTDAQKRDAILEMIGSVETEVIDAEGNIKPELINEYIDILNCGLEHLPADFDSERASLEKKLKDTYDDMFSIEATHTELSCCPEDSEETVTPEEADSLKQPDEVYRLYNAGIGIDRIAKMTGISRQEVETHLSANTF